MIRQLEQRAYQQRIIKKTVDTFKEGGTNVLIYSPPGSGKTVMGFSVLKRLLDHSQELLGKDPQDVRFGWMAMRRNLLVQAKEENEELVQVPNVSYISMFDKNPPEVDVLVPDEAQHDAANSAHHIHAIAKPKLVLGLSATPFRTDRMKLCFDRIIQDAGYHSLIQGGYLSEFEQYMLDEWSVQTVCNAYLDDPQKWGKSMMFFLRHNDCFLAESILKNSGVRCEVVTGSSDRFTQIEKFENGDLDVLINVFVLTEGFNCPEMCTVFVRDSSKGPTIQMAGRVLRKHNDHPIKKIVQSTGTKWPFVRTASAKRQFIVVGGDWRSLGTNELVEVMRQRMLRAIAQTRVDIPEFVSKHFSKSLPPWME